jgi:hypothetical protein
MPSISDVFDQLQTANQTLSQINTNIVAEISATNAVTAAVQDINATLAAIQTVLSQVQVVVSYEAQALFHISQQNDTIICTTEHVSQNTCNLVTEAHVQTRLETAIAGNTADLVEIERGAFPAAALEVARVEAVQAKIDACCPPPVEPPACVFQSCPAPPPLPSPPTPSVPPPIQ